MPAARVKPSVVSPWRVGEIVPTMLVATGSLVILGTGLAVDWVDARGVNTTGKPVVVGSFRHVASRLGHQAWAPVQGWAPERILYEVARYLGLVAVLVMLTFAYARHLRRYLAVLPAMLAALAGWTLYRLDSQLPASANNTLGDFGNRAQVGPGAWLSITASAAIILGIALASRSGHVTGT